MLKKKISRHAIRAVSYLWVGSLLAAGCAFLAQVILARSLSASSYGAVSAVLTAFSLASPLAGFGIQGLWLRVFGKEGFNAIRWMRGSLIFCILSTSVAISSLVIWALLGEHDGDVHLAFVVISMALISQPVIELIGVKLQLEEKYSELAIWQLVPHVLRLFFVTAVVFFAARPLSVVEAVIPQFLSAALVVAAGFRGLRMMYKGRIDLKGHPVLERSSWDKIDSVSPLTVFKSAWPFGFAVFFHLIYFQSAVLVLKYMVGDRVAGVYNVAFIVMSAVYIFPAVVYHKFLIPKQHRWAEHDRHKFYDVYRRGNVYMLAIGVFFALIVASVARQLIGTVFGVEYIEAADYLLILCFCIPLRFVATSVGATLLTQAHMLRKVKYMGGVAICNIFSNLMLLPRFGGVGACYSALLSEAVLLAIYFFAAKKYVFSDFK